MDYEKEYKESLERARQIHDGNPSSGTAMVVCEQIFPELAESEDERIRKDLITYLKSVQGETLDLTISVPKWIAYLEKQKESLHISETCKEKPNSFTDKDEKMLERVLESLVCYRSKVYDEGEGELAREIDEEIAWMQAWEEQKPLSPEEKMNHPLYLEGFDVGKEVGKVLAEPVECGEEDDIVSPPQNWDEFKEKHVRLSDAYLRGKADGIEFGRKLEKQMTNEWSEEDEEKLKAICTYLRDYLRLSKNGDIQRFEGYCDWLNDRLKSIRPVKQEWTEEEKQKLNRIYSIIGWAMDEHAFSSCKKLIGDKEGVELQDFLRSIAKQGQQPRWKPSDGCLGVCGDPSPAGVWKPSEEQMGALAYAIQVLAPRAAKASEELENLREQLKKMI